MLVFVLAMASPISVRYVGLVLMFNVVWSQKSLSTQVMSTNFFSLAFHLNRIVVVVLLPFTQYSVVQLVILLWTLDVLQCHILQDTNNMSIPSLSVIELKMTLVNIIAIFVKKNGGTQSIGFTTVRIAVILRIQIVLLGNTQITSLEVFTILNSITHTLLLSLRKLKTTLHVTNVMVLVKSWSINVLSVISTFTRNVYKKDKCDVNFYFILHIVHISFGEWNSSNENAIILLNVSCWHHGSNAM